MKKQPVKPVADHITEWIAELLKSDSPILGPAICLGCGSSWIIRLTENAQFTAVHRCHAHRRGTPRYRVLRLAVERIGATREERDQLAYARRRDLSGRQ